MSKVEDNKDDSGDDRMIVTMVSPTDGGPGGGHPWCSSGRMGMALVEGDDDGDDDDDDDDSGSVCDDDCNPDYPNRRPADGGPGGGHPWCSSGRARGGAVRRG